MDDQRENHIDPGKLSYRNHAKQLQTTYDVKNTNGTYKERDLLLANKLRIVPQGRERMEMIQTSALLKSARILRRVLETWGNWLSLKLPWKTIS